MLLTEVGRVTSVPYYMPIPLCERTAEFKGTLLLKRSNHRHPPPLCEAPGCRSVLLQLRSKKLLCFFWSQQNPLLASMRTHYFIHEYVLVNILALVSDRLFGLSGALCRREPEPMDASPP